MSAIISRNECIQAIAKEEVEQIVKASIDHIAIPVIMGFSLDNLSQAEYRSMGGLGEKPAPLSSEAKMEIYNRIKAVLRPLILEKIKGVVNSVLQESLASLSDEELRAKLSALNGKAETTVNFSMITPLFKDHLCLYKEMQKTTTLKLNLLDVHEIVCPVMSACRDSELLDRINIREFQ